MMQKIMKYWSLRRRILHLCCTCVAAGMAAIVMMSIAHAEDGVTDNTILIGQTVGITGQIAGPVKEMNAGAIAYFSQINKAGGVNGRKLELRTLDDQFDPALAASNAQTLVKKDHVFALFLSRGTPHTQAILPILQAEKIPLIAPSTGAMVFHVPSNRYVFNVRAKYQDEVKKGVEQFATTGLKEIALIYVDDTFGHDGLEGFSQAMDKFKLTPSTTVKFDRAKPDVKTAVASLIASSAKAVIVVSSAGTTSEIIRTIRTQGSTIQIMTLSNNASQSFIDSLGVMASGVVVSQITPAPHLMSSVLGQEFKLLAKNNDVPLSYAAMEGFIAAKVLVEGLRRSGRNLTREGFIKGLETMRRYDLGGLMVSYSERDHGGSEFVDLTMIGRDGKFVR